MMGTETATLDMECRDTTAKPLVVPPCTICGAAPCRNPSFCSACRIADQRAQQRRGRRATKIPHNWHELSLDSLWGWINDPFARPTPAATIEAIRQAVRDRGLSALDEPETRERLQHCDERAIGEIDQWISR